jgi:hypothetical protein
LNSLYEIRFPEGPEREKSMAANSPSNRYTIHVRRGGSGFIDGRGEAGSMGIAVPSDLLCSQESEMRAGRVRDLVDVRHVRC